MALHDLATALYKISTSLPNLLLLPLVPKLSTSSPLSSHSITVNCQSSLLFSAINFHVIRNQRHHVCRRQPSCVLPTTGGYTMWVLPPRPELDSLSDGAPLRPHGMDSHPLLLVSVRGSDGSPRGLSWLWSKNVSTKISLWIQEPELTVG